jgi:cytosine/adenosine deaminase-related metal-dependent hydrolase
MAETLIRGGFLLTQDENLGNIPEGDVLIRDNFIAAVGCGLVAPNAEVIDATGRIVMPGLIDGHRHMFSGILRGACSNTRYVGNSGGYFDIVIRQFGGSFTPEDTYVSSQLGALESLNGGITTLHAWDHNMISHEHARASASALIASGLRGRYSYGPPNSTMILDQPGVLSLREERFGHDRGGRASTSDGRWTLGIATRGVELGKPEIWEPEFAFARQHGIPITAHVMDGQMADMRKRDALGSDVLAVHVYGADAADIQYLKESGTTVCIATPASARSGSSTSPVIKLMEAGIPLCLSVDSTAGCDTADMFAVMRITMIVERMLHHDAGVYSCAQVLKHATLDGARALGIDDITGSLTPGKRADIITINTRALNLAPLTVPETLVASCVYPSNVESVFVDGKCLKRDGRLLGVDVDEFVALANATLRNLEARVGRALE